MSCVQNAQTSGPCPQPTIDPNNTNRHTAMGGQAIGYDAAGNISSYAGYNYYWDGEGRLSQVTAPGGSTQGSYIYNALGQRVAKYNGSAGQWTDLLYDAFGNPLVTRNQQGTSLEIFLPPVAGRNYAKYEDSVTYYLHANNLASTGMITDQSGTMVGELLYYPWGGGWASAGAGSLKDVRFAGMMEWDPETYFYPTAFRMYSGSSGGEWGRWLSPDPVAGDILNPQSLNRYAYVLNNPATLTDPLGLRDEGPRALACSVNGSTGFSAEFCGSLYRGLFGRGRNLVDPDLLELRLDRPRREPREPTAQPPPAPPPPPPPSVVNKILGPSLRQPGESVLACTDRVQRAVLGKFGAKALGAVSGVALFSSALTLRVGGLTSAGRVSGTNIINTRIGTSAADLIAEGGVEAGTISAETGEAISAGATVASKVAIPIVAVSAALEGAFLIDCR